MQPHKVEFIAMVNGKPVKMTRIHKFKKSGFVEATFKHDMEREGIKVIKVVRNSINKVGRKLVWE